MGTIEDSPLLRSLFNENVTARVYSGVSSLATLHPEEARLVASAVAVRQAHFTAGRRSAHAALEALGIQSSPILSDAARAPIWPKEVVGSITHTDGFCGAVAALRTHYRGIGIDAEVRGRVDEELWEQILTPAEVLQLRKQPVARQKELATIIFCAKEAFYKCQYQVTAAWLGFEGAEVFLEDRRFDLDLLEDVGALSRGQRFTGRFEVLPNVIIAGIAIGT
jgi:4'-phosphopantetheinyl transferase EntD